MRVVMRALAFAAGGLVGGIAVVLLLRGMHAPGGIFINWHAFGLDRPPTSTALNVFALALGAGLGDVAWLGFEAGRAVTMRFPRLGEGRGRAAVLASSLLPHLLLGVLLGFLSNLPGANDTFLPAGYPILAFLLVVPLAHSVLVGWVERPNVAIAGITALLYGPVAGMLFGLSTAYVYVATYQPQPCTGCRIVFPPEIAAVYIAGVVIGISVGLAIVTAGAETSGLLVRLLIQRPRQMRQSARRNA